MENRMHITTELNGTLGIVTLAGDMNAGAEDLVMNAYRELAQNGAKRIILRFSPGCSINSAGIAVLITMVSQARQADHVVGVFGLTDHYKKIFQMIGLSDYVTILVDEASVRRFSD